VGAAEASEEMFLFRSQQPFAKGLGFGMAQGLGTERSELAAQSARLVFGALGAPRFQGKSSMGLASIMDKALDVFTKQASFGIGGPAFEQGQFLLQFFGLGFDMGQAGLPILGMDSLIRGVSVSDNGSGKALAQDALGRLGGAMLIQMVESQIVIAGIPSPILVAVMAPGGFVGVNDG